MSNFQMSKLTELQRRIVMSYNTAIIEGLTKREKLTLPQEAELLTARITLAALKDEPKEWIVTALHLPSDIICYSEKTARETASRVDGSYAPNSYNAPPVLEQQESDGDVFIVMRNPGKVPDIKRPVGDLSDYLIQLYQHNPEATCDVVTYRFAGVSGQWVQDGRELLSELEMPQPSTTPQIDDDGWIDWSGGICPVDEDAMVDVLFRDGSIDKNLSAGGWHWGVSPDLTYGRDIIAYRVIENDGREG